MYTEIYNPICAEHECINVGVYDNKVGFLCYKSDEEYSSFDIATPVYTVDECTDILSAIDKAVNITENDFQNDVNSICFYWNVDKPCQKLEITALLCDRRNKPKQILYYVESSVAYGDFDLIGGYIMSKSTLIEIKNAFNKAIENINHESV